MGTTEKNKDVCLFDSVMTNTILCGKHFFLSVTLREANVRSISSLVEIIDNFMNATIVLPNGTTLHIEDHYKVVDQRGIYLASKMYIVMSTNLRHFMSKIRNVSTSPLIRNVSTIFRNFRLGLGSVERVSSAGFSLFTETEIDQLGATNEKKPCQPKKRKLTSKLWTFFERLPEKNSSDGKSKVKCKLCGYILNYESKYGTSNLKRHNDNCVRKYTRDIGQMIFSKEHNSMLMRSSKFDPKKFCELVVAAIVMHNLPLSFVEYTGIKSMLSYLREDVVLISRNTVKAHIIKMHKREKCKIQSLLQESPGRICLTFDLWTSIVIDGYMCLTAHFVDKN
ncbi:Ac-like transposase THELMA13 [Theobroma cacao]|uniref:Ac-like transposase THELMA13 n=1 Tax=Theobroma cacao TaxID=3641 RepID=A0A061FWY1_THECC|nr:Ac-like transposase THELMA13 [Theobroma cacao]